MTNDTVASCRAALLKACTIREYDAWRVNQTGGAWISVDDAAACMARYGAECFKRGRTRTVLDEVELRDQLHLAALAAVQGGTDG